MPQTTPSPRKSGGSATGIRVRGWLIVAGLLLIVIGAGALYYLLRPLDAPIPADAGSHYQSLEKGFTEQGFPRLGRADAPVVVEEFSSYACPHCREFHEGRFVTLLDAIAAGQVQFVFIPMPDIGWGAGDAAKGALCAGEQGHFWTMTDVLFDWQRRFITSTFDTRRIRKGAQALGLDIAAFDACLKGEPVQTLLERARQEFSRRGLTGTPSFFINGHKVQDYRELDALVSPQGDADTAP
ncbi:MAG: hypothetical protein Kow00106_08960 [Anaerolineae bacterium]